MVLHIDVTYLPKLAGKKHNCIVPTITPSAHALGNAFAFVSGFTTLFPISKKVERVNGTIKNATVKATTYQNIDGMKRDLNQFL
jgi:hypothetical protein